MGGGQLWAATMERERRRDPLSPLYGGREREWAEDGEELRDGEKETEDGREGIERGEEREEGGRGGGGARGRGRTREGREERE